MKCDGAACLEIVLHFSTCIAEPAWHSTRDHFCSETAFLQLMGCSFKTGSTVPDFSINKTFQGTPIAFHHIMAVLHHATAC